MVGLESNKMNIPKLKSPTRPTILKDLEPGVLLPIYQITPKRSTYGVIIKDAWEFSEGSRILDCRPLFNSVLVEFYGANKSIEVSRAVYPYPSIIALHHPSHSSYATPVDVLVSGADTLWATYNAQQDTVTVKLPLNKSITVKCPRREFRDQTNFVDPQDPSPDNITDLQRCEGWLDELDSWVEFLIDPNPHRDRVCELLGLLRKTCRGGL